jgi:hypothetical protein
MNRIMAGSMITAAVGLLLSGCVTHEGTVYRDVERTKVEFENDTAARLFYETLSRSPGKSHSESHTTVDVPFVFRDDTRVVSGRNVEFNEAVERCDSNHDGKITELEARIFSEHGYNR